MPGHDPGIHRKKRFIQGDGLPGQARPMTVAIMAPPFNPRQWRKRRSAAAVIVNNNPNNETADPQLWVFLAESAGRAPVPSTSPVPTGL
jgi:hypothetical protein